MGSQWALSLPKNDTSRVLVPKQISGWFDVSLEAEYRYSKMMSFFVKAGNVANQRYYRWENYPTQRFNFMVGLTFVPF
jgi:outer membrane receptor protein involved in Fe transport